jgi:hypothetical protein
MREEIRADAIEHCKQIHKLLGQDPVHAWKFGLKTWQVSSVLNECTRLLRWSADDNHAAIKTLRGIKAAVVAELGNGSIWSEYACWIAIPNETILDLYSEIKEIADENQQNN